MPIGDSITEADGTHFKGYRYHLGMHLLDSGITVDFVGPKKGPFTNRDAYHAA